jgi:hypothetical protein
VPDVDLTLDELLDQRFARRRLLSIRERRVDEIGEQLPVMNFAKNTLESPQILEYSLVSPNVRISCDLECIAQLLDRNPRAMRSLGKIDGRRPLRRINGTVTPIQNASPDRIYPSSPAGVRKPSPQPRFPIGEHVAEGPEVKALQPLDHVTPRVRQSMPHCLSQLVQLESRNARQSIAHRAQQVAHDVEFADLAEVTTRSPQRIGYLLHLAVIDQRDDFPQPPRGDSRLMHAFHIAVEGVAEMLEYVAEVAVEKLEGCVCGHRRQLTRI